MLRAPLVGIGMLAGVLAAGSGLNYGPHEFFESSRMTVAESTHSFDIRHYCLDLTFSMVDSALAGSVRISARSTVAALDSLSLDFAHLTADQVFCNGVPATFLDDSAVHKLRIGLGRTFAVGDTFQLEVVYHGTPHRIGYYWYRKAGYTPETTGYTVTSPCDAPYWYPCYDQMWDKATCELYATVPEGYTVAGNGLLLGVDTLPTLPPGNRAQVRFHWYEREPVTTYLICATISRYVTFSDWYVRPNGDSVEVRYYVYPYDLDWAKNNFALTPAMVGFFSRRIGEYPFEKYGMATVYPFKYAAMEHTTMTTVIRYWATQGDELGIAHELAHQWWGNCVSALDWRHIWLKEGFATYGEVLWDEYQHGVVAARDHLAYLTRNYFDADASVRRPIYDPPMSDLFNYGYTYCKGALVNHMLRGVIGDSAYFRTLRAYFERYQYGNATIDEFRAVAEEQAGTGLEWFFNEWIYQAGHPEYAWSWSARPAIGGYAVDLTVQQVQSNAPIFKMPVPIAVVSGGDTTWFTIQDSTRAQDFELSVTAAPDTVLFDPYNWVTKKIVALGIAEPPTPQPVSPDLRIVGSNPARGPVTVRYTLPPGQTGVLSVLDAAGRVIESHIVSAHASRLTADVPAGVYFVRIGGSAPLKLVRLRE